MKKVLNYITVIALALILSACAQNISPNSYSTSEVGVASKVKKGVVISKREVQIDNNSGVGGLAGTAAGATLASTAGNNLATGIAAGIGGAIVGGVVGNAIDKGIHHQKGYEYIIQLQDGETISMVQNKEMQFAVNQKVLIIYGATTRLIADESAA